MQQSGENEKLKRKLKELNDRMKRFKIYPVGSLDGEKQRE